MSAGAVWALVLVAAVLVALVWYCAQLAMRLDRLHWRILSTREQLDRLAVRRAAQARQVADAGILDQGDAELVANAAMACLQDLDVLLVDDGLSRPAPEWTAASDPERTLRRNDDESALSQILRRVLDSGTRMRLQSDVRAAQVLEDLDMACYRVRLARSMHNLDVTQVRRLRRKPLVRLFHLYGRAVKPEMIDFDDQTQQRTADR